MVARFRSDPLRVDEPTPGSTAHRSSLLSSLSALLATPHGASSDDGLLQLLYTGCDAPVAPDGSAARSGAAHGEMPLVASSHHRAASLLPSSQLASRQAAPAPLGGGGALTARVQHSGSQLGGLELEEITLSVTQLHQPLLSQSVKSQLRMSTSTVNPTVRPTETEMPKSHPSVPAVPYSVKAVDQPSASLEERYSRSLAAVQAAIDTAAPEVAPVGRHRSAMAEAAEPCFNSTESVPPAQKTKRATARI